MSERERLSHAYIIASQSQSQRADMARRLTARMLCTGAGEKPCMKCKNCRKVLSGIHPDVTVVSRGSDDKGKKKREVTVAQIRAVTAAAPVVPNEAEKSVFIVEDASDMNVQAQNAMLKTLEEPPEHAVFILLAENAGTLLETVRSRCVLLEKNAQENEPDREPAEFALQYARVLSGRDALELVSFCMLREKMDTEAASGFVAAAIRMLTDMLCFRRDDFGMTRRELMDIVGVLHTAEEYLRMNVGVKHVFGMLSTHSLEKK